MFANVIKKLLSFGALRPGLKLLVITVILVVALRCDVLNPTSVEDDAYGHHWDDFAYTTWYIEDGDGNAIERWKIYPDSLVADIDHFRIENGRRVVTGRTRMLAKVYTKDMLMDYYITSDKLRTFRCTELQWKRMWPSLTADGTWTYVYDYSTYQYWCIEWKGHGTACIGDVPKCYIVQDVMPYELDYGEGWIYDKF